MRNVLPPEKDGDIRHEQRLNRTLISTMKMLNERQAARKERKKEEMKEALEIDKLFKMKGEVYNPADDGFGFGFNWRCKSVGWPG